jgi:hypothetical protein
MRSIITSEGLFPPTAFLSGPRKCAMRPARLRHYPAHRPNAAPGEPRQSAGVTPGCTAFEPSPVSRADPPQPGTSSRTLQPAIVAVSAGRPQCTRPGKGSLRSIPAASMISACHLFVHQRVPLPPARGGISTSRCIVPLVLTKLRNVSGALADARKWSIPPTGL